MKVNHLAAAINAAINGKPYRVLFDQDEFYRKWFEHIASL